jgi:hypothetical protein
MASALDSGCQISLALCAVARFLTGFDSTTIGDETSDARNIFVVDCALFAEALTTSSASASKWWAAAALGCSGGCHFLPRGKDSGII